MKHVFMYYLHDDALPHERATDIARETGLTVERVLELDIGRPFYEVKLVCFIDDETGRVTLESASL